MEVNYLIERQFLSDGENKRIECPCSQHRKKKHQKTLSITREGDKILYKCFHCGIEGVVNRSMTMKKKPADVLPMKSRISSPMYKSQEIEFLKNRGITEETAKKYDIRFDVRGFNSIGQQPAIGFPYYEEDNLYAVKWRTIKDKHFTQEGSARTFFGMDKINIKDLIVICEGEFDALALHESGVEGAVSVPNGAVLKVSNNTISPTEDKKFKYVWSASDKLDKAEKIVLCCDNDESGRCLTEELARRIGKNKVFIASIPKEFKDANECMLKKGKDYLKSVIENAEPYPLSGLYKSNHYEQSVVDLYEKGFLQGVSTGYANVDELFKIALGQLSVVTGIPSSGKSEFIDMMMMNLAKREGWKFAVCSFENPPDLHIAKLVEKYIDKPFFSGAEKRMNEDERDNALKFIEDHFIFIDYLDGEPATIDSIIEKCVGAVRQMGCRGIVIDPYNYIEMDRSFSETDSISKMLTKISRFAKSHSCHVWIVSHPHKLYPNADGKIPPPTGYSISGSASWFAKADIGLTVHRGDYNEVEIHSWKCRFKWIGKQGMTKLDYNPPTGVYSEQNFVDNIKDEDFDF
tara:strand:+ start:2148 stop:3872 length:1725 start_codon:yes stop_codon:yes gene_type:complete